jgi:hypothetical protein
MDALLQDGLADETVGPNITWLDLLPVFVAVRIFTDIPLLL